MKLSDNEIIKALECCIESANVKECLTLKCPLFRDYGCAILGDEEKLYEYALDLIKRQQAEIERLADHNKQLRYDRNQIKSEAYKEFAERLKEHSINIDVSFGYGKEHYTEAVTAIEIDNLLAELTPEPLTKIDHSSLCETDTYKGDVDNA